MPCDARVADGAIRGGLVGLLWAGFFGPSEIAAHNTRVLPLALRYVALSTLSFSAFFGAYSGLLCRAEHVFGTESPVSSVVAGGATGCAIGATLPPRGPNAFALGLITALISGTIAAIARR